MTGARARRRVVEQKGGGYEGAAMTAPRTPVRPRPPRTVRRRAARITRWAALAVSLLVLALTGYGWSEYRRLDSWLT